MTYIKWKDEVESYLVSLPNDEKQKIFSYFSEMYADKRDAGKSEAQIIEEFGAPYDVAKKILAESRDAAAPQANPSNVGGGAQQGNAANVNVNINVNGGAGAPKVETPHGGKELPERNTPHERHSPPPAPAPQQPKKQTNVVRLIVSIILTIVLVGLSISLIGSAIALIIEGFIEIGFTAGALASSQCGGADGAVMIGVGMVITGLGCMLLAPFNALCKFLWRKLKAFMKGV
ncbi:MAG: DUF1700 domain-containing protein [Clostridia bacterium]|nr:DUF1700 domain-containing protein [Clostridia bacterium]